MRIGGLCAGYGGLEMAVQQVIGGELAWYGEIDRDASTILAHHHPGIPNHGDLTTLAWADHPVDILCAGFPCQPVSGAGKRKGVHDERWLFDDIVAGVGRMDPRPRLLVFENVLGLLSANGGDAMARVVQGLASVGYMGRWRTVRAADAGAPHNRRRVFIVATPADAGGRPLAGPAPAGNGLRVPAERGGVAAADPGGERHGGGQDTGGLGRLDSADAGGARERERAREVPERRGAAAAGGGGLDAVSAEAGPGEELRDLRSAADSEAVRQREARGSVGVSASPELLAELREQPTRGDTGRSSLAGSPDEGRVLSGLWLPGAPARTSSRPQPGEQRPIESSDALCELSSQAALAGGPPEAPCGGPAGCCDGSCAWGQYAPAIHRWEMVLGRLAPPPTEPGKNGQPRLSPRFVEHMMGLPAGHVTDAPISRNAQLKALGNGVVPAQAALALRMLLVDDLAVAA